MIETVAPLLTGLVAGAAHVLAGPDHLAAVAPLAVQQARRSWVAGVRWGTGHSAGVILVAVATWLLRDIFPVERFSSQCERLVGVMLIAIGLWGLRKALSVEVHVHEHFHDGSLHQHIHIHHGHADGSVSGVQSHAHSHAALAAGLLHGLAGGAHFLGVLPALAMPTRAAAALYILAFAMGTVVAMTGFSSAIGALGSRMIWFGVNGFRGAMSVCSIVAIAVGIYWLAA